ncbi:MAG: FG-GAP-like repeat-containing protein [Thermoplasmatota archaeon]
MDLSRRAMNILLAFVLISGSFVFFTSAQAAGDPWKNGSPTRAIPWNQIVPGTEITIAPGKSSNTSFYYPVPLGATVLDANFTFSNIPYTPGGYDHTKEAWVNFAGDYKEYVYGLSGEGMFGSWGFLDRTRLGERVFEDNLTSTSRITGRFVLPKNATLTSATLNITGYQRGREWEDWVLAGTTAGEMVGHVVRDLGGNYVGMGDPGFRTSSGRLFLIYGNSNEPVYTTLVSKSGSLAEYGYSISDPFTIKGKTPNKFAVGAPGDDSDRGYVEIINLTTTYSVIQTLEGNLSGDRFGEALSAGDINGDGLDELVVGAPSTKSGIGSIYIFHQVQNMTSSAYEFELLTVINGSSSDTSFGRSISIGDINRDSVDDIAVASDQDVYVIHGASTFDPVYDTNFDPLGSFPSSSIQTVKFLGRMSGTVQEALGIGLPEPGRGGVLVHYGGSSYDTSADVTFIAPSGAGNFGWDLDAGYDINGDAVVDIAIGAPGGVSIGGYAGIFSLSSPGTALWSRSTTSTVDRYGASIAFGTDLRGDGFGDVVVGAPEAGNVGRTFIYERFPLSQIPPNSPVLYVGPGDGVEAWRYQSDHLTDKTMITSGDISGAINSYISTANPSVFTPYEGFVYVDIGLGMATFSSVEESNHFRIEDFRLTYTMQRSTGQIANAFNTYLNRPDANIDPIKGIVKVPITYGGLSPGGLRIETFDIELDLVPEIDGVPGILHVDEDSHVVDLIDAYLVFEDDYTDDEELTFQVNAIGDNITKFKTYIANDRFVAIDLPNGSESANWTGTIEVSLTSTDINGGRSKPVEITIEVDAVNDPPAITTQPTSQIIQGAQFQYLPHAVDTENDEIMYDLEGEPQNMTIDEQGTVIFKPNGWQIGDIEWTLVLDDGKDKRYYPFTLNVININDAPIFSTPAPENAQVKVGETYSYSFKAYDLDPLDSITFSLPEGPTGSSVAFETGYLTWRPIIYLEEPQKFRVRATDLEGAFSEIVFFVNITLIDNAPTITSTPTTTLSDFVEWVYNVWVTEPDDDVYFVELYEGPPGMEYDEISESLVWTPNGYQLGTFDLSIRVTSTRFEIFQNFSVYVERTPRNWIFTMDLSSEGPKVKGDLTVGGQVSVHPSTVQGIYLTIGDEDLYIPIEGEGWTYIIKTKDYSDGELVISAKAYDGFENSTSKSFTVIIANDEGKTNPILIVAIIVLIVIIIAVIVLAVLLVMRKQKKAEEEEERQKKFEEIKQTKDDINQFIDSCTDLKSEAGEDEMECFDMVKEERLAAIDEIFLPMKPGQMQSGQLLVEDEDLEDPLQKAIVQESVLGQDPPVEEEGVQDDILEEE